MRTIFTTIFFLILPAVICISQTQINLNVASPCIEEALSRYSILVWHENNDSFVEGKLDSTYTIEPGINTISITYGTHNGFADYLFSKEFVLDSTYSFTIELPRITEHFSSGLHNQKSLGFYKCEVICDGKINDYYNDGTLRMSGKFNNGRPIKKVKYYNSKGELIEVMKYDRNGKFKKVRYPDFEKYILNH